MSSKQNWDSIPHQPISHIPWNGKYILINIERVSKHSIIILGLRVVTPAGLEPGLIISPPASEKGWVARSQHGRCTETSPTLYKL